MEKRGYSAIGLVLFIMTKIKSNTVTQGVNMLLTRTSFTQITQKLDELDGSNV